MPPRQIVILGGVGSGVMVAETIKAAAAAGTACELRGFLNDALPAQTSLAGYPVLGPFERWRDCGPEVEFISAIPNPKQAFIRRQRILSLGIPEDRWTSVLHPTACIATEVVIGSGSFIGPFVVVEPGVVAGSHVCLRGHSYISHDVRLGSFVFVGSQATVLGRVVVEDGAFVGAGVVCREHGSVGRFAVVGAGTVVLNAVPDFAIVAGNPARQIGTTATVA